MCVPILRMYVDRREPRAAAEEDNSDTERHTMMHGVPHAHASRGRAVETSSPPPWGSAWPTRP
eukprot:10259724-Lingulodinium_polyedra.AAC.1